MAGQEPVPPGRAHAELEMSRRVGVAQKRDWLPRPGVHWENWSTNGEVCITGLVPPVAGGARLAQCLTWLVREFASHCRRIHARSHVLAFTYTGPRTATLLARQLSQFFDLALQDAELIREHVRRRSRREPAPCQWPAFWLEGATYEYPLRTAPPPLGRVAPRKLLVLAEERQVFVPARPGKPAHGVGRTWTDGLEMFASLDETGLTRLLDEDEQGFLANMLVLVHAQPAAKLTARPSLEASYRRHEALVASLAPLGDAARLPVAWHALWRLPPGLTWAEPGQDRWLRYPAVSFVVAARPFEPASTDGGREATIDATLTAAR